MVVSPVVFSSSSSKEEEQEEGRTWWSARHSHRVVRVPKSGRLLLVGGFSQQESSEAEASLSSSAADVWEGEELCGDTGGSHVRWRLLARAGAFGPRDGHALATLRDAVFLVGGSSRDFFATHDVWRLDDQEGGWRLATAAPGWCGRTHHALAVEAGGSLVLLGGFSEEAGYLNDAWTSKDGVSWERVAKAAGWSKRAVHGACTKEGAIFVAGGYDGQKPLNDVWASADGGKSWTRLCRRAPWSPRKGHALLSTDRSLILAGGQGGTSSFGDCWTSDDGASWSLLCLDAPPRHLHAAVLQAERPERDGRRNVLVLGGETSLDDGPAVAHADGWTVEIPPPASTASSPLLAKQQPVTSSLSSLDRPILDVSMRSVVAALAELRQLRAGLREVQRGNVQLCDDVRASTTFDDLQKTLDDKDTDDDALLLEDDERPHDDVDAADHARFSNRGRSGSSRSLSSALTFSARLQRAVAATIGGKFFSAVACQPLAAAAEKSSERSSGHDDDDDDDVKTESFGSFFDARTAVSDDERRAPSAEGASVTPLTPLTPLTPPQEEAVLLLKEEAPAKIAPTAVLEAALALDAGMDATWRETIWPLFSEIKGLALDKCDDTALANAVGRRKDALARAAGDARRNGRRFAALEAAAKTVEERATAALERVRRRADVEKGPSSSCGVMMKPAHSAESEVDDFDSDSSSSADFAFFDAVEAELVAHCTRPERANSARRATDGALTRLGDVLRSRVDAADALRASMLYVATDKHHENEQTKLEQEVSQRSLQSAESWDSRCVEAKARLDAHTAVGEELVVIPKEVGDALALKRRLLDASGRRCRRARRDAAGLRLVASLLRRRAATWRAYFDSHDAKAAGAARLCDAADDARASVLALEDARVDVNSALEKLARRKRRAAKATTPGLRVQEPAAAAAAAAVKEKDDAPSVISLATSPTTFPDGDGARRGGGGNSEKSSDYFSELFFGTRRVVVVDETKAAGDNNDEIMASKKMIDVASARDPAQVEALEAALSREAVVLDGQIEAQRRALRRTVAAAARRAFAVAPEVARDRPVVLDALGHLNLFGVDATDDASSPRTRGFFLPPVPSPLPPLPPPRENSWFRSPRRDVSDYEDVERIRGKNAFRAVDRHTGEAVLLKAYALGDESDDAETAEIDALMALPRHEAVAAPRAMVAARWAPVSALDEKTIDATRRHVFLQEGKHKKTWTPLPAPPMVYLEFPLPLMDAARWAAESTRAPWHVQAVARQILTALIVLHSHGVVHAHLAPTAVVLVLKNREHRALLATSHLVSCSTGVCTGDDSGEEDDDDDKAIPPSASSFAAPEVVLRGEAATPAADMFSFGATLRWLHERTSSQGGGHAAVAHHQQEHHHGDASSLRRLVGSLTAESPAERPSATDAMLHPYFQNSYMDRFIAGGDVVGQNEKLDAVRDLLKRVRSEMRASPRRRELVVSRETLVADVLAHFSERNVRDLAWGEERPEHHATRWPMKVTFRGEEGVDEGGLTAEMFALFFQGVLDDHHDDDKDGGHKKKDETKDSAAHRLFESSGGGVSLPRPAPLEPPERRAAFLANLEAFGRALVTACYEGCGAPSRLAPSLFKFLARGATHVAAGDGRAIRDLRHFDPALGAALENMLTHPPPDGADDWGLDFDDVVDPEEEAKEALPGERKTTKRRKPVTEANKHQFCVLKVRWVLTGCRVESLTALRRGFENALNELSPEASPLLKLFSSTDWRVILCSDDDDLTPDDVLACLAFARFQRTSVVPGAMKKAIAAFSTDSLRRFLVFATGSPSLPQDRRDFTIQVRALPGPTDALPVSHTCFFHLDVPDYPDEATFLRKFTFALFECNSFSIL